MRKLSIIISIFFLSINSYGQPTRSATAGFSPRANQFFVVEDGNISARNSLFTPRYDDSTQANAFILKDTCGAVIYLYSTHSLWYRSCVNSTKAWVEIGSGAGGGGTWGSITGTLSNQTDLQNALNLKANLASPTFTGTVTIPSPFTLGATSVLTSGAELNFVDGVTSNIQTQLDSKVSGSLTADRIPFASGSTTLTDDANFYRIVTPGLQGNTGIVAMGPVALGGPFNLLQNRNYDYASNSSKGYGLEVIHNDSLYDLDSTSIGAFAVTSYENSTGGNSIHSRKARGTLLLPTSVLAGDRLLSVGAKGYVLGLGGGYGAFTNSTIAILAIAAENFTTSSWNTYLSFEVTGAGVVRDEVMRMRSESVDVYNNNFSYGANDNAFTRTNNVTKSGRIYAPAYAVARNVASIIAANTSTANNLYIGGGSSLIDAATIIRFQTASALATTSGTERWRISGAGNFSNTAADGTAFIDLKAGTTSITQLSLAEGVAPTTPADGNIWHATDHLYARLNGVTYQLDQQSAPTFQTLSDGPGVFAGQSSKGVRVNVGETALEYYTITGGGDVSKVGTPVNNQLGVWTGNGTIEGDANLTFASSTLNIGVSGSATGIFTQSGVTSGTITFQPASAAGTYTLTWPTNDGDADQVLTTDGSGVLSWTTAGSGANTVLSNLGAVAINTSLISDADNTDDLGSAANGWKDVYLRSARFDGSTSGTTTLIPNATAGTTTVTLPAVTGTVVLREGTETLSGNKTFSGTATATGGLFTNATAVNGNFGSISGSTGSNFTTAELLFEGAAAVGVRNFFRGSTTYTPSVNSSYAAVILGDMATQEAASGTSALSAGLAILSQTILPGAGATTNLAGLYIEGPPTGITPTVASYSIWAKTGNVEFTNGNLTLGTAGNKLNIATGSNASVGISGAMTAGSITISTTAVTANSIIQLTPVGAGSGQISIGTITAGTSFVINSSDGADTRIVHWTIIN